MAKERLIWRPNEIPLAEWEKMSRDDQIRWWKSQESTPSPKPHMKKAIRLYNQGNITQTDFCSFVMKAAVPEEIDEFVQDCPPGLLAVLKEELKHYPADESKWPRTFCLACYAPWVTAEAIEESRRKEQELLWNGVRILKEYFNRQLGL